MDQICIILMLGKEIQFYFFMGIHFIQEDNPHLIGKEIATWYKKI